jgi:hypothetical protein
LAPDVLGSTNGPHATDPEIELTDLESGTYVCTMVVDP